MGGKILYIFIVLLLSKFYIFQNWMKKVDVDVGENGKTKARQYEIHFLLKIIFFSTKKNPLS